MVSQCNTLATLSISNKFTGISNEITRQRAPNHRLLVNVSRCGRLVPIRDLQLPLPRIISRDKARALGLKRFFTGKPCKHGHIAECSVTSEGCVACHRQQARKYRAANLEKVREKEREYGRKRRATNPGRVKEVSRAWRAANLEKVREGARERAHKYRAADPERARENWRRWRAANLEKAREGERERSLRYNKRQAAQQRAARAGSEFNGAGLTGS